MLSFFLLYYLHALFTNMELIAIWDITNRLLYFTLISDFFHWSTNIAGLYWFIFLYDLYFTHIHSVLVYGTRSIAIETVVFNSCAYFLRLLTWAFSRLSAYYVSLIYKMRSFESSLLFALLFEFQCPVHTVSFMQSNLKLVAHSLISFFL